MAAMEGEEAGSDLKLYCDLVSAPSRAVAIFCRANEINAEEVTVHVLRGETRTPEYLRINPLGKIPFIDDGGFKLNERYLLEEGVSHIPLPSDSQVLLRFRGRLQFLRSLCRNSHAILRYLATTRDVADQWYPKDAKRRALIDSVLDWHHFNIRRNVVSMLVNRWIDRHPNLLAGLLPAPDKRVAAESEKLLKNSLEQLETVFLREPGKFLANGEQVSIADLSLVCELKQTLVQLDTKEVTDLFGPRKKITAWMDAVEEATNPHFSRVTTQLLSLKHQQSY